MRYVAFFLLLPTLSFAANLKITVDKDASGITVHSVTESQSITFASKAEIVEFLKQSGGSDFEIEMREVIRNIVQSDPNLQTKISNKTFTYTDTVEVTAP